METAQETIDWLLAVIITLAPFAIYIAICYAIGKMGAKRHIGFWPAFVAAVFLTPVFGVIIAGLSNRLDTSSSK